MKERILHNYIHTGHTPWRSIILVIVCTILTSAGQVFYKLALKNFGTFHAIITNYYLYIGLVSYALGAGLLIIALKNGELSVLYPIIALSFVWVAIVSIILFAEHVSFFNWIGIVAILIGVSFIGAGSRHGVA